MGHLMTTLAKKTILFQDQFNRPDNAASIGQGWQSLNGVWGIASERARFFSGTGDVYVVREPRISDCAVGVQNVVLQQGMRMAFRFSDANNGFIVSAEASAFTVYRREAGVYTSIGTYATTPISGDRMRVLLTGSSIKLFINDTERLSVNDTFNQTATKHGIGGYDTMTLARFDNFKIEVA